jgi:subtilisin family serine protease
MMSIGKGVKIAVVDTGVDYFHPSLGNGFGPGKKISFGKDFVGVSLSMYAVSSRP